MISARFVGWPGSRARSLSRTLESVLGETDAAEAVLALVERSLVVRPGAAGEYRLLDTLRAFARARTEPAEIELVQGRTLAGQRTWQSGRALGCGPCTRPTGTRLWRAGTDMAAAVRYSLDNRADGTAHRIVGALFDWAEYRVRLDVLAWGRELADVSDAEPTPDVLAAASAHAWSAGEPEAAADYADRSVAAAGGVEQPQALAGMQAAGDAALAVGDTDRAYEIWTKAHSLATAHREPWHQLNAASGLLLSQVYRDHDVTDELELLRRARQVAPCPTAEAMALYSEAEALSSTDPSRALDLLSRARQLAQSVNSRLAAGVSMVAETALLGRVGDLDMETVDQTVRAIEHWQGSGNDNVLVTCLRNVVTLLDRLGAHRAVLILSSALVEGSRSRPPYGAEATRLESAQRRARARLSAAEAEAACREGAELSLDHVARRMIAELRRGVESAG